MRAFVAPPIGYSAVPSLSIVEDLDVEKQTGFGLLTVLVVFPVSQLLFQSGEEAFDREKPSVYALM